MSHGAEVAALKEQLPPTVPATPTPGEPPGGAARRLGALRHRNFRILWFGTLFSNVGTWMHFVVQGWLLYELTDSVLYLGLVGLVRAGPLVVLPLAGGILADRFPRALLMLITQAGAMVLTLGLAILTVSGAIAPWHILLFAFATAALVAFESPARQALLPDLVAPEDLTSAISLSSWGFQGAALVGPALAAMMLPLLGMGGVFFLNAASYGGALLALVMLRDRGTVVVHGSARQNFWEGFRFLRATPVALTLIVLTAAIGLLGRSYTQLMPVFARDYLGLSAAGMGYLYTAAGLGTSAGLLTLVVWHQPRWRGRMVLVAGLGFAIALGGFAVSRGPWLSAVLLFLVGMMAISFTTLVATLLQSLVPDHLRGRVMSVYTLSWQGMEYVSTLLVGTLAAVWSAPAAVLAAAVVIAGLMLAAGYARRDLLQLN